LDALHPLQRHSPQNRAILPSPKSPNVTIKTQRTRDIPRKISATLKDQTALEVGIDFLGLNLNLMGSLRL
jgi:hypothetical protein